MTSKGRRIGESDLPAAERALLRTLLTWASPPTWELYPTIATIAKYAGRDQRTVQRLLGKLENRGVIEIVSRSTGGVDSRGYGRGHRMRLYLSALSADPSGDPNPDHPPASNLDTDAPEPRQPSARTPAFMQVNPGSTPGEQAKEPTMEPTTNSDAAAVATLLGSWELLRDPNATPERLALIVREAPSKRNPAGYAAAAIRGAWNPPKSATSESAISREQRRGALAEFDGMSAAD